MCSFLETSNFPTQENWVLHEMAKFDKEKFMRTLEGRLSEQEAYAPLKIGECQFETKHFDRWPEWSDFEVSFTWRKREFHFIGEIKTRSFPQKVKETLWDLKERWGRASDRDGNHLLALPYLSVSVADLLEETGLSGIDLNGNYMLQTDDFVAIRLDQENQYKESGGIKNVFRGTSSLVCRYLLQEPGPHDTVTQIHEGIKKLDGRASLSTVSKVLSALENELIIEKGNRIRLLQPEKMLRNLQKEYQHPEPAESVRLSLPEDRDKREEALTDLLGGALWIWDGKTSAERYATTTPSQEDEAYTRELPVDQERLETLRDERFYNCVLHESREDVLYFGHDEHWASDIQTHLELMQGDKREREIATDLENRLLRRFDNHHE